MPGLKINAHGLFRKNSRFRAMVFSANPARAKSFGQIGNWLKININSTDMPNGEIVATSSRLMIQTALFLLVKSQKSLLVSRSEIGPVNKTNAISATTSTASDSIFLV